jgi:hypothetical protein
MNGKFYFVCLLALAGSVSIYSAIPKYSPAEPSRHIANHQIRPRPKPVARAASAPPVRSGVGKAVSEARAASLVSQIAFEPNVGQADPSAEFVARGNGMTILLVRNGFQIEIQRSSGTKQNRNDGAEGELRHPLLGVRLVHSTGLSWTGEEKLRGATNYFLGSDPQKWRTHVPRFARAQALSSPSEPSLIVYPGQDGFEYDLRVPPGTDMTKVRLALTGSTHAHLDRDGDLLLNVSGNEVRMRKPIIYEQITATKKPQVTTANPPAARNRPTVKRSSSVRRTTAPASAGPKKKTRRRTPASIQKAQRHRQRKKIRGSNARPPAMRPPRTNPPQKRKRPPNPDRPAAVSNESRRGKPVKGAYILEADGTIGFHIGPHDPGATLVIDPSISIVYSSFLGGAGSDSANSLAMDSTGDLYVGGTTTSAATFPESGSSFIGPNGGTADLFIAKIDPSKSGADSLVYLTFLGGSGNETGGLVAVDSEGNAAIAGTTTSTDFPVTDGSKFPTGPNAATVTEIDPTGSTLLYSTIFGGNGTEAAQGSGGLAFDGSGNIFVASDTSSTNLPVTSGAFQGNYGGGTSDGFLAIFKPASAPHLKYCTYLGINAQAAVGGLVLDAGGNVYLAGFTTDPGSSFPAKNAFQSTYAGDPDDSFLMQISPAGKGAADLIYATLLGGQDLDETYAVAVDLATPPNAYVTGTTQSTNFPTSGTVPAYATSLHTNAAANAFLTVVAQNATTSMTSLAYSTYLGGSETDSGEAIAVTAANSVYVTGSTTSFDFPWLNNLQPYNGDGDAFVAKLDPTSGGTASLIYSTPLGGTAPQGGIVTAQGQGIAARTANGVTSVFSAGQTTAADFPTAGNPGNGFQLICGSCQESPPASNGFVVQISESAAPEPSIYFTSANLNFGLQPVAATNVPPQFAGVYNGGESPLQISLISIAGANGADFSLLSTGTCLTAAISPGSFCSFGVGFVPSIVGPEAGTVSFSTNAPGSPQVLELIGIGQGPIATLSALSVNFGNQPAGSASTNQIVNLTNSGSSNLILTSVKVGGQSPNVFPPYFANTCVSNLVMIPGSSCTFGVSFAPPNTGAFTAEIDFVDNSGGVSGSEQIVQLSGTGVPPGPIVTLQPSSIAFGTESVGSSSSAQTVTLSNAGSTGLNLTSIAATGANAVDFGISAAGSNPCPMPNGTVVSGSSCTVGVFFAPQTGGSKSANLSFTDDASGSPQSVPLSGTATAPSIQISPTSLNFNSQSEGTTSPPQGLTLSNNGTTPLAINSVGVTGANSGDFTETNNCPPSLGAGLNCVANVSFKPAAPGSRSASVSIADNVVGSPQTIPLAGTGTQAAVSLSPASINFGNQLSGVPSAPVTITVTNTGTGSLTVSTATTSGTNASDFTISANTCTGTNVTTPPNATCTMQVTFTPACSNSTAARAATLSLTDNAPGSPQTISLSGTATGNFCVVAPAGSLTATVASGVTANYSLNLEAANSFSGTVTLVVSPPCPPSAVCSVSKSSINLAGNTQTPFDVIVATKSGSTAANRFNDSDWKLELLLAIAALLALLATAPKTKNPVRRFAQMAILAAMFGFGVSACGGGSSGGGGGGGSDPVTPAGTYTITLTGTASGVGQPTTLTLIVK